jgi:ABC-type lipoprotein export system ATPase subunit
VTAVSVKNAFRIYGEGPRAAVALQGMTLDVEPGEIVVVLGPSGSGKTTLLRVVCGLDRLNAGSASVLGRDLASLGKRQLADFRRERLGFLDQHYTRALSPELDIRRAVGLQLTLRGRSAADASRVADELLERVGLLDRRDARPRALSGGEQQRVAVCAAAAHRPELLLVDEPAGELDAESAATVYAMLAELVRETRASALVVSHDAAAAGIADRIVHVRDGRVVEEAAPGREPGLVVSSGGWVRLPGKPALGVVRIESADGVSSRRLHAPCREAVDDGSTAPATVPPAVAARFRGVGKSYGERVVVHDLDLSISGGRMVAVVGRSGSGKTTLLHLLAGLERPTAGDVFVLGQALDGSSRASLAALRRRSIAIVTQEPGLVPHLSALENVVLGLALRGATAPAVAESALRDVGLEGLEGRRAAALSAGERQRVAIARAAATGAALLLADEPTARLDEENARLIGRLLARAAHERGVAVVCATHDPELIDLADDVMQLESA